MSFTAAIDISTFIWSKEDYSANKNRYYNLISIAPTVFEKIKELKLPILLKKELYGLIMAEFPYNMIREVSYEFEKITLSFLTNAGWYAYSENTVNAVSSNPGLLKQHFNNDIKIETQSQVCHLFYNGENPEHKFIAYGDFFEGNDNLTLSYDNNSVEVDTLRYNSEKDIKQFFERHKIKFEHNSKHTRGLRYSSSGEKISPFTSYHQPNGQLIAQQLLELAIFYDGDYYNFDLDNNVYVRFLKTHINQPIYHGHDLSDEEVPEKVREKFNKHGRVF